MVEFSSCLRCLMIPFVRILLLSICLMFSVLAGFLPVALRNLVKCTPDLCFSGLRSALSSRHQWDSFLKGSIAIHKFRLNGWTRTFAYFGGSEQIHCRTLVESVTLYFTCLYKLTISLELQCQSECTLFYFSCNAFIYLTNRGASVHYSNIQ